MPPENEIRPGGNQGASEINQSEASTTLSYTMRLRPFLEAIFGESFEGEIEIRVLCDVERGRPPVTRKWYPSIQALLDDLPRILPIAQRANAGIFFGVLLRREIGVGKAEHTLPGRVLWCDIDFKHFSGGEAEARALLASFPVPPSIIVRSGGGLHCYWLLRAAADPQSIEAVNKRFVDALHADNAWDAPRVLRLPRTYHRKDPADPRLVEIETLEPTRLYDIDEIAAAAGPQFEPLETPAPDADEFGPSAPSDAELLHAGVPGNVQALLNTVKRVRDAFMGLGKPETDSRGKLLDRSASGYDFTLVRQLVRHGVRDPLDLAKALARRPDGGAAKKGVSYIRRTVQSVLDLVAREEAGAASDPAELMDFIVTKVVIFTSNPPAYAFTIDGVELRLDAGDLLSRGAFVQRFLEGLHRIPTLPDPEKHPWSKIVNGWLRTAERVEQPPEASKEGALREAVEHTITAVGVGDSVTDLDRAKAILLADGRIAFRLSALFAKFREEIPDARRHQVSRVLRELGFEPGSHRVGDRVYHLWCGRRAETEYAREGESS